MDENSLLIGDNVNSQMVKVRWNIICASPYELSRNLQFSSCRRSLILNIF